MGATYKTDLLTVKDRLRFRLGDTDTANALLQDAEYAAAYRIEGTEDKAAVYLAKGLIRKFAQDPVRVVADGVTLDFSGRVSAWRELVQEVTATVNGGLRVRKLSKPQSITDVGEYSSNGTSKARCYLHEHD